MGICQRLVGTSDWGHGEESDEERKVWGPVENVVCCVCCLYVLCMCVVYMCYMVYVYVLLCTYTFVC